MLLVRRRPEALTKAEIHQHLWPDTFVSDGNLAVLVAEIRSVLSDNARQARFVRTVQRFGYAFVGSVDAAHDAPRRQEAAWSLAWGHHRAMLSLGENVLGRDPAADVFIDAVGVSRRHAVIVVGTALVTLEDLSSKNGTFLNGARLTGPAALEAGAVIRLGPVPVRLCSPSTGASTETWDHHRTESLP
jgi:hypothetical protein